MGVAWSAAARIAAGLGRVEVVWSGLQLSAAERRGTEWRLSGAEWSKVQLSRVGQSGGCVEWSGVEQSAAEQRGAG